MGRKGKNKSTSQDQGGSSGPLPGTSQNPQPSTSGVEKKEDTPRTTGSDRSEVSRKGAARVYEDKPPLVPEDARNQPHQSRQVWGKSGGQRLPYKETTEPGYQKSSRYQAGRHERQWTSDGQQRHRADQQPRQSGGQQWLHRDDPRGHGEGSYAPPHATGQQQWHNRNQGKQYHSGGQGQWSGGEQQWRNRDQREQYHSRGQGQWPNREQQGRGGGRQVQTREDSRPFERQYQSHEGKQSVWQKQHTPEQKHVEQKPQSPKVAEEAPSDVGQRKQTSDTVQQPKGVEGAPDKVQPSTSRSSKACPPKESDSTGSDEPSMELVPVYKEPGTLARKKIKVQSNHFALNLGALKEAYHYDVTIQDFDKNKKKQPEKPQDEEKVSKNRRVKDKVQYKVMQAFLNKYFPNRFPSFDGKKNLYSSKPLTNNLNDVLTDTGITVVDDFGKEKTFSVEIKWAKTISLIPQTEAERRHPPMLTQNAIQCIDIVLRNAPIHCFNQIGSSFFRKPRDRIIELGGGMEMYYGFYQSVVMGGRPLLNVHLVHKAFPKDMFVLDAFIEVLKSKDARNTYQYQNLAELQRWQINALNDYIKTLKVVYEIPNVTKVIYKVNELAKSPRQEKMLHNGTTKTILEYFRTEKGYNIKYPDIPLLWVGSKNGKINILIPPELCRIEKDQSVKRKMEDFQTTNMIKEAATNTNQHRKNTMNRFNEARYNNSPFSQEFGFSVCDTFEVMDARILPTPQLQYGEESNVSIKKGTWQNSKFLISKPINKWAIVDMSNDRFLDNDKLRNFVKEIRSAARTCGVDIQGEPFIDRLQGRNRYGLNKAEVECYFRDKKNKNYDIIFVVIPSSEQGGSIYSYVKRAAELQAGCLTQCVKSKTITGRFNMSTAVNILLKVNGKLDGVNHTFTKQSKPKLLTDCPVMIMGADVTHPPPRTGNPPPGTEIPSVAAVIASHDPKAFQYNTCLRLQEPKMEYIEDLKAIVKEQLEFFFKKNNGTKPGKIIFFRDGVSEGQFGHVLYRELQAIKNACMDYKDYNPKITFLVVQKRHHTRLFPLNDKDSEDQDFRRNDKTVRGNYNVPAGTCVDTTIVNPKMQNFYLVSHASLKGVSRPTKYCTLYDDLDLTNDEIEELSYYLCHMFARCNRSVSYPAPTYYAHLAALRGKAYIKPALDENSFNIQDLQEEMSKIQLQPNILNDNPMFFI